MKQRWHLGLLLLSLAAVLLLVGVLVLIYRFGPGLGSRRLPAPRVQLVRSPNSAYKYHLCAEAYAYLRATPDNPYKTDFTFQDPFRNVQDTIIPHFVAVDAHDRSLSFSVTVILRQLATVEATISHIHELDGIGVQLPDRTNQLQGSSVPQFVVVAIAEPGTVAVLDYTCPQQWHWSAVSARQP
ncbi:hypothetical protein [Thermogemmatispora carboxidivorans]|uniref:hypothetical protein n=1 Tax=Thermogemmatispora carboxidivorans TaxID=1382306 RepID=UPI000699A865|nr:hypothetical protein [Thermogemmatispora carboxidivorans]